jgi:DNA polymerase alpha-associated DNA helicase A
MALKPVNVPLFATTQLALLATELQSELASTSALITTASPAALQRAGLALTNLVVAGQRTGAGGTTVLELALDAANANARAGGGAGAGKGAEAAAAGAGAELPEHGVRVGDVVSVGRLPAGGARKREVRELEAAAVRGVVVKVGRAGVSVALDGEGAGEEDEGLAGRLWLVKLANDVTYKR